MKIIENTFPLPGSPYLDELCRQGRPLFLDIETAGFSAKYAPVYLAGGCYPQEGRLHLRQWLAERPEEEEKLLESLNEFLQPFSLLVHFNGDRFDLPYLEQRSRKAGIDSRFLSLPSLDLMKKFRPLRELLHLPDRKLKTLEAFLGIRREDRYDGGQLISVYQEISREPDAAKEQLLLLHNQEDVLNLPRLLPLLSYADFGSGNYTVEKILAEEETKKELTLTVSSSLSFPAPVFLEKPEARLLLKDHALRLTLPLLHGELKYFLKDYRDYYFLPAEDTAVHKSVAAYVDKAYRRKATARTAYLRREGVFFPAASLHGMKTFQPEYGGPSYYLLEEAGQDAAFWESYLKSIFRF